MAQNINSSSSVAICDRYILKTIPDWLAEAASSNPQGKAISSVEPRPSLTYGALLQQIQTIGTQLNLLGLKPGDLVVIALDNSAEFLSSILAVASVATAFPLNPLQPKAEFQRYFDLLDIKAVIVTSGSNSAVCTVAESVKIPILELNYGLDTPAGKFNLTLKHPLAKSSDTLEPISPKLEDLAILIGTSGSTGLPKIISVTHESFFVTISQTADWMQLTKSDRSLVLTPLATSHALSRSSCPLLLRGGEVICTPGYNPAKILDWLDRYRPSFFTAVPSMYRSLLQRIESTGWIPQHKSLRFLVTGSDRIDATEINAVEKTFNVPLIQLYGMTEVSPLPATSPLPPAVKPIGAVGQIDPMWQVACVDERGNHLPLGEQGEIILRGGYINQLIGVSPEQASKNIRNGWFYTGDLGYLDDAGWLYYTGRVDNRIDRGGKKVYAADVETILLTHPEIKETVVFGIPDTLYGETIGAVVVLEEDATATPESLRQFVAKQVAEYKIPDTILIVDTLPLNRSGKVKRKNLAEYYGLNNISQQKSTQARTKNDSYVPPQTETERRLAAIWAKILQLPRVSVEVPFWELGGHSLLVIELFTQIEAEFGRQLPVNTLLDTPTIRQLARLLSTFEEPQPWDCLVRLKSGGDKPALFLVHDADGDTMLYFNLARHLHPERPVYGLRPYGKEGFPILDWRIEQIVDRYIERILSIQPEGPYCLGGLCDGGVYAYEVGQQLQARGHRVGFIALLDAIDYEAVRYEFSKDVKKITNRPKYEYYSKLLASNVQLPSILKNQISVRMMLRLAKEGYVPQPFMGQLLLFRATATEYSEEETPQRLKIDDPLFGWQKRATEGVKVCDIPDTHSGILRKPSVKLLANEIEIAFTKPEGLK